MNFLLVCSGGMSTSIVVKKLNEIAFEKGDSHKFEAVGVEILDTEIDKYDYILVAPQIKYRYDSIKEFVEESGKKAGLISFTEYTPIGAKKLYERVVENA